MIKFIMVFVSFVFSLSALYGSERALDASALDVLKSRVEERWSAKEHYNFELMYTYQTPAYRHAFPKALYVVSYGTGVVWDLKKIGDVGFDKESGVATVVVDIETSSKGLEGLERKQSAISSRITEKWLHINGQWWHSSSK